MGWEEAGIAWSDRAGDWAGLMEPHFLPVYEALAGAVPIRQGMRLLDVGCGAGLGLSVYTARGAACAGIDASQGLLDIAQDRVPTAELRHGTMLDLPWPDGSFDAVVGVNAFFFADDGALVEAHRVLRPGGTLGLGYWTDPGDFAWPMATLRAALEPYVSHQDIATPLRTAEPVGRRTALVGAGFTPLQDGQVEAATTFVDRSSAYRALASTGMIYPIVQAGAEGELRGRTETWLQERADPGTRFCSTFGWTTATRV
jgi:SAM-dependent methyltransferase